MPLTPALRFALRAPVATQLLVVARAAMAFALVYVLPACVVFDQAPTAPPVAADQQGWAADVTNVASTNGVTEGTAGLDLEASASITQTGDTDWTLEKTGSLSGTTVTWNITATEVATVSGQLRVEGTLVLTNLGDGPAPIGNVVVNLQTRVGNTWVSRSSDIANATQGDAATTAAIHAKASSENLGSFTENSASGALTFADALTDAPVSLAPTLVVASDQTRELRYTAVFDNTDALLQLAPGSPVRAEVIVTFGNATVNGNSTPNVDINGNGTIDADEARVRSVPSRLDLTVPSPTDGNGSPTLSDTVDDIAATGDVTFSNVNINLGATSGTVTATVNGGANGGTITNCAHLTSADQTVNSGGSTFTTVQGIDLQACSTINVGGTPPTCTSGAPGCGWDPGDMRTFTQNEYGDGSSAGGAVVGLNFSATFGGAGLTIGGANTIEFTNANAVFAYLPQTGPAGVLTGSLSDPITSSAGELGGEVLALQLNVDFSAANVLPSTADLGSLYFCNFTAVPSLNGQTVGGFLDAANVLLGGGGGSLSPSVTASVAAAVNSAFVDGAPSSFAQTSLQVGPCTN